MTMDGEFFFRRYLDQFNDCVGYLARTHDVSFHPCLKNKILKCKLIGIQGSRPSSHFNHIYLDLCHYHNLNYTTCITMADRHICNIFPVMLGSDLDLRLLHHYRGYCDYNQMESQSSPLCKCSMESGVAEPSQKRKVHVESYSKNSEIHGYFVENGRLCWVPYILTNNRELPHIRPSRMRSHRLCINKYSYTQKNKGHCFELVLPVGKEPYVFVHRNPEGQNFENDLDLSTLHSFEVDDKHIAYNHLLFGYVLKRFVGHIRPIDSFSNKLIFSPSMLLIRLVLYALDGNEEQAKKIVATGNWCKLVSMTNTYKTKKRTNISNLNRKPLTPQIGDRDFFGLVVRPVPKNIDTSTIPTNYQGFLCLFEKNVAIDSFNRVYSLISDVNVAMCADSCRIEKIISKLVAKKYWLPLADADVVDMKNDSFAGRLCTFNSIFPLKYKLNPDVRLDKIRSKIQRWFGFIEVLIFDGIFNLNYFQGMPFKKFVDERTGRMCIKSAYEMAIDGNLETALTLDNCFGPHITEQIKSMFQYAKMAKLFTAINYLKTKLNTKRFVRFFELGIENVSIYLDVAESKRLEKGEDARFLKLNTVFTSHPQLTEDGYAINANKDVPTVQLRRFRMIFNYNSKTRFRILLAKDSAPVFVPFNKSETVFTQMHVYCGEVHSSQPLEYFNSPHFNVTASANTYRISLAIDDNDILSARTKIEEIKRNVYFVHNNRLIFEVIVESQHQFYDGLKLSNTSSQKGIAVPMPMAEDGIDCMASIYSVIGRSPLMQLKEMRIGRENDISNMFCGKSSTAILKNIASDCKSIGFMKFDNLSINNLQMNGCNTAIYNILQRAYSPAERYKCLPAANKQLLQLFLMLKKNVEFTTTTEIDSPKNITFDLYAPESTCPNMKLLDEFISFSKM